jgi:hypothetical protein
VEAAQPRQAAGGGGGAARHPVSGVGLGPGKALHGWLGLQALQVAATSMKVSEPMRNGCGGMGGVICLYT